MEIVAALFIDTIELRQVGGPSTRIDLGGVQFSAPAPGPFPVTISPHLVVMIRCPLDGKATAALEVTFHRDGEQIARNAQPLAIEPGKFNYRLVRAELAFDEPGTVEAQCRVDLGPITTVPYTVLAPLSSVA